MALLYTNENFPEPAVGELRKRGHDVLTTHEAGNSNAGTSDLDVVRYATANGRVVVTLNRKDFIKIHKSGEPHAGIVVCTVDPDNEALATRIDLAILVKSTMVRELIRVARGQYVIKASSGPVAPPATQVPLAAKPSSEE
jgi:predicted nuclease of predicted toxin-antitoxin system